MSTSAPTPPPRREVRELPAIQKLVADGLQRGYLTPEEMARALPSELIGKPAPEFSLPRLDADGTIDSNDLAGQVVVVNFWASWCVPCRDEHPALQEAWGRYRERGVVVRSVLGLPGRRGQRQRPTAPVRSGHEQCASSGRGRRGRRSWWVAPSKRRRGWALDLRSIRRGRRRGSTRPVQIDPVRIGEVGVQRDTQEPSLGIVIDREVDGGCGD